LPRRTTGFLDDTEMTVQATPLLLRPARVWTGASTSIEGSQILVRDDRISAVGSDLKAPTEAMAIDLPGVTLVPGLMDLHSHLFLHPYSETSWDDQILKEPEAYRTARAVTHARSTLHAGFTLLRDLGTEGAGFADVSLKRAIDEGLIEGPRMVVATRAIVATGSYGPRRSRYRPDCCFPQGAEEASGRGEIVRAVRRQASHGADWIKVYADYAAGPVGEVVPTFSVEELKALVDAAQSLGRPVSAHATSDEGMRRAAEAGVNTIEHGYGGQASTFRIMAKRGIALLPTLMAAKSISLYRGEYVAGSGRPSPRMAEAARALRLARAEGVVIGCGSDVGVFAHGRNCEELISMVKLGLSPHEALMASTAVNANILGRSAEIGHLHEGYLADIAGFEGDPLASIEVLGRPRFVMKNGTVFLQ
jgi:imidazolonepropionase-like amidohydrolase